MAELTFSPESPAEYFKGLIELAIKSQQVKASKSTQFYLVNLLSGFVRRSTEPRKDNQPLAVALIKALQTGGFRQRDGLRRVGDLSLFISGFHSDSLNRSLVDVDYYISLGVSAYGSLTGDETFGPVFDELSERFVGFVDVLGEVSERSSLATNADLLRLYEKWLRTRSRRSGDLLVARGILPNRSLGSRSRH